MGIRWGSVAGLVTEACFVAGDVLLLGGKEDPERYALLRRDDVQVQIGSMLPASSRRLRIGALLGVLPVPLYILSTLDQASGIADGGRSPRAGIAAGALAGAAHSLSPIMHGSHQYAGEAFKAAQQALEDGAEEGTVDELVAQGNRVMKALDVPYLVYGALTLASSLVMTERIARDRTAYPRWSAAVVPPLWPIVAMTAVTASPAAKRSRFQPLQGAGISLGLAVSFAASTVLHRR